MTTTMILPVIFSIWDMAWVGMVSLLGTALVYTCVRAFWRMAKVKRARKNFDDNRIMALWDEIEALKLRNLPGYKAPRGNRKKGN